LRERVTVHGAANRRTRRLNGLYAGLLVTAMVFASQTGIASASPLNVAGSLFENKTTCQFEYLFGCREPITSESPGDGNLVFVVHQAEGSAVVSVSLNGSTEQSASATLSGTALEFNFLGPVAESRGIRSRQEKLIKISFSANGLAWSGSEELTGIEEGPSGTTRTLAKRTAIQGVRAPASTESPSSSGGGSKGCVVPSLKGRKLAAAEKALLRAHCAVGKIRKAGSRRIKKGSVISQSQAAGRSLSKGTKVALVVSKG
jgi:PASTA domain